jgi:hypothetical protein
MEEKLWWLSKERAFEGQLFQQLLTWSIESLLKHSLKDTLNLK